MSSLCAAGGLGCGQSAGTPRATGIDLRKRNPPAVQEKKSARFWPAAPSEVIHKETHRPHSHACGKPVRARRGLRFSPDTERMRPTVRKHAQFPRRASRRSVAGTREQAARQEEQAARPPPAGYHSPVCSNTGDAIDRIAAAIDQLASDAHDAEAGASEDELTERVATLWQMVSDLDPELARRARRYTGPVDGGPSA